MKLISIAGLAVAFLLPLIHESDTAMELPGPEGVNRGVTAPEFTAPEFTAPDELEEEEEDEGRVRIARSPWGWKKIRWSIGRAVRRVPKFNFGVRRRSGYGIRNIGRNIEKGARSIGRNIDKGARNIGRNVDKGARNIGRNVDKGARNIGRNVDKGARNIGRNVDKGARNIGRNVDKGARNIGRNVDNSAKEAARNVKETIKKLTAGTKGAITKAGKNLREIAKKAKKGGESIAKRTKEAIGKVFKAPKDLKDKLIDYLEKEAEKEKEVAEEENENGDESEEEDGEDDETEPTVSPTQYTASNNEATKPMSPLKPTAQPCNAVCVLKKYAEFFKYTYCAFYSVRSKHADFYTLRNKNVTLSDVTTQVVNNALAFYDALAQALQEQNVSILSRQTVYEKCANDTLMACSSERVNKILLHMKCLKPCKGLVECESDKLLKLAINQAIFEYAKRAKRFLGLFK